MARPLKRIFDQEEIDRFIKPRLNATLHIYTAAGRKRIKTSEDGYLRAVLAAEAFVLKLSHSKVLPEFQVRGQDPFMQIVSSRELLNLGTTWQNLNRLLLEGGRGNQGLKRNVFPRIMAFYKAFESLMSAYAAMITIEGEGKGWPSVFIKEFEQLLEEGFEEFKCLIHAHEVTTGTKRLQTRINRNRLQQQSYVDSLIGEYNSLYCIYLDLGYDLQYSCNNYRRSFDSIRLDFECFMKERRHNPLWKDDLVGYLWKLSDGAERGYHYHLILFYRGDSEKRHLQDKQKLCEKWIEEVTKGYGACFELSSVEDTLLTPGGIVDSKDSEAYCRLVGFIRYLNKLDYLIQLDVPTGINVYGRGQIAKV